MNIIGTRIKMLREMLELSQQDLAERIDTSAMQIYRWETHKTLPSPESIVSLAGALMVTTDYLLGLSDDPEETFRVETLTPHEKRFLLMLRGRKYLSLIRHVAEIAEGNNHEIAQATNDI